MDLLQLKYFKVVAEQEHITKSAKLLMVSQPYLSAIVARLEEEMGGQLFDRDGRNVVLNEYGKILLHHANEALQHLEDAKKEIADMRSRDTKYIRLGSSSTMLSKRWLVDFLKEHDDIRLAHLLAAHNEIMDGLLSGRFDFGLTTGRLDHPKIISVPRPLYTAGRSQAPYGPPPEDLSAGYPKRKDLRPAGGSKQAADR